MPIQKPLLLAAVTLIHTALEAARATQGPIHKDAALNLLAQLEGCKDWEQGKETLLSKTQSPQGYTKDEVKDWPTFVVFMSQDESPSYEEQLFMLAPGSTLANRMVGWQVDESDSVLLPSLEDMGISSTEEADSATRMSSFVVKEIYSVVANVSKYGLPHYANDLGVKDWIKDMGWNFLAFEDPVGHRYSSVDVGFTDTGDDGCGHYWMEVAVAPNVAEKLTAAYTQAMAESHEDASDGPCA